MTLLPKDLLDLTKMGLVPKGPIVWDTETSGLYPDDGARVATASIAFEDVTGDWLEIAESHDNVTWAVEDIAPGLQAAIISIAWPFDQGVAGTGKPEDHGQMSLWQDADNLPESEWVALLDWMEANAGIAGADPNLIAQNAKFDCTMMRVGVRRWPGVGREFHEHILWDTQLANDLIWPLHPTSLKPTVSRVFGQEFTDESKLVQQYLKKAKLPVGRWDLVPWDIIGPYADQDARIALMLYLRQRWEIDNNGACTWLHGRDGDGPESVYSYMRRRLAVMRVCYNMEKRGLPYAEVESREAALECQTRAATVAERLPYEPTINAAKHYYFGDGKTKRGVDCLNLIPYSVTDKGAPQMTEEIVTRMVADEMPFARDWAEYTKASNAASMWYQGYADKMGPDGRLRCVIRQNGTISGRFSVERINLQAIPQDYRLSSHSVLEGIPTPRQLIALAVTIGIPGWKLWELDLAQAELRVAAQFAKCKRMLSMIENGDDLHTYTTQHLFRMEPDHEQFGMYRQVGKRGNFSLIFDSGPDTFRKMVSKETGIVLEPSQAFKIVRDWRGLYPEFGRAVERHMNRVALRQAKHGFGWVDLLNGERRWFGEHEDPHKAFNQRVQPNLAQFGMDWMLETEGLLNRSPIHNMAQEAGIGGAGLLLTIHDSQVLLLPDNALGDDLAKEAQVAGRRIWAQQFDVPGDVDMKMWSK